MITNVVGGTFKVNILHSKVLDTSTDIEIYEASKIVFIDNLKFFLAKKNRNFHVKKNQKNTFRFFFPLPNTLMAQSCNTPEKT